MRRLIILVHLLLIHGWVPDLALAQQQPIRPPIIDVHLHALGVEALRSFGLNPVIRAAPPGSLEENGRRTLAEMQKYKVALAAAGAVSLLREPTTVSPQTTIDSENRYSNVGALMVWRVDAAGSPVELRGFASGTLIRDRVIVTAGHFTAPASALGTLPPSIRIFASFSSINAKDPETWIRVVGQATHPSMPYCPPPPKCDPTDELLVAPLQPGIADVGLVFLAHAPMGIKPARLAEPGILERFEGANTTIVGYGTTSPGLREPPIDAAAWDGRRRFRASTVRRMVDETWGLWSIPSYVCHGDSGGAIFLNPRPNLASSEVLAANVSDGGQDCRSHNNNNRLDTRSIQNWINDTIEQRNRSESVDGAAVSAPSPHCDHTRDVPPNPSLQRTSHGHSPGCRRQGRRKIRASFHEHCL